MNGRKRILNGMAAGLLLLAGVGTAGAHDMPGARGETFSDPSIIVPMPHEWEKQPIVHDDADRDADLVIVMDQDIYHTLLPSIRDFSRKTGMKIDVKEGTCGIAAGALAKKRIDMGGFCCPPGSEDRLPGLRYHTLGIVGIVFFVNPANPIDGLSTAQLRGVFRGTLFKWSELKTSQGSPGPDRNIQTVGRLHCQLRPGHWRQVLDKGASFSPRMQEVGSIPDMIAQVAESRDAIGWEVLTMVDKYQSTGAVKPLLIDGFRPSDSRALATLKYPFYRTYTVSTWEGGGPAGAKAEKLVEYLKQAFDKLDPDRFGFVSAERLRKAGWKFRGDEVVGEPR